MINVKRITAFILIVFVVFVFVMAIADAFLIEVFFNDDINSENSRYAFYYDEYEMVYFIQNEQGKNQIVKTDDSGNVLVKEIIPVIENAEDYVVQDVFVSKEKNIYISAFHINYLNYWVDNAIVLKLDKDGKYVSTLVEKNIIYSSLFSNKSFFSSFSEDDDTIHFGILNDGTIDIYEHDKYSVDSLNNEKSYKVDAPVHAIHVNPENQIFAVSDEGSFYNSADRNLRIEEVDIDRDIFAFKLYHAVDQSGYGLVYVDSKTRDVIRINTKEMTSSIIRSGQTQINDNITFKDLNCIAVNPLGESMGILLQDDEMVLASGNKYTSAKNNTVKFKQFDMNVFFAVCILIGIIVVSILIYDIYINIMKEKMSMLFKRGLIIAVMFFVMAYALLNVIIKPQYKNSMTQKSFDQVLTAARVLGENTKSAGAESYDMLLTDAQFLLTFKGGIKVPIYASIIDTSDGNKVIVSNKTDANGYYLYEDLYAYDIDEHIEKAKKFGEYVDFANGPFGLDIFSFYKINNNTMAVMSLNSNAIDTQIEDFVDDITLFIVAICILFFAIFLVIEIILLKNIIKLRKGVDEISAGNFDVDMKVESGDEIENLANAFIDMSKYIKKNTNQLNNINSAYHRFVPQKLFRLLGENSILDIGKDSYVQKNMKVMNVTFDFLNSDIYQNTKELFDNINEVFEHFVSVVTESGGTVYNFHAGGFVAVFSSSDTILKSAVRIREKAIELNNKRQNANRCNVDARVVLACGNVMLGVVGDKERMAVTAISNVIEKANTLNNLLKPSGINILCTHDIADENNDYRKRYIGKYRYEKDILMLYDVYEGDEFNQIKFKDMYKSKFDLAVKSFYSKDMEKAKRLFLEIVKHAIDDGVSRNYLYITECTNKDEEDDITYRV